MVTRKAKSPSWIKRGSAAAIALAAAASGVAVFSGNLASVSESIGKLKWWEPKTHGKIDLRSLRAVSISVPTTESKEKIKLEVEATVVKTGDASLKKCQGQITLGRGSFTAVFPETGAIWQVTEGEHQEIHQYKYEMNPVTHSDTKLYMRIVCQDMITDWYFVARVGFSVKSNSTSLTIYNDE